MISRAGDSRHDRLLPCDPQDMSLVNSFPSPGSIPLGLAWDGGSLFSVDGERSTADREIVLR